MIRNKAIVSSIVALLSIAYFSSINVFSDKDKILEEEISIEKEMEVSEEDKNNHGFIQMVPFDFNGNGCNHCTTGSWSLADHTARLAFSLGHYKSSKIPYFILFCCLKTQIS